MQTLLRRGIYAVYAILLIGFPLIVAADTIRLAAASDLKFALEEITANFQVTSGHRVNLTYGSSGLLATQIRHGAPFHVFMSADEAYVHALDQSGLTDDAGTLYALGRIVLMTPKNSQIPMDEALSGLKRQLENKQLRRFAIANPEHAPYGKRAEEALRALQLWEPIKPHLVYGENVSQAAQFAMSGSADGGIVAFSLVKSPQLAGRVNAMLLPPHLHQPLRQRMVLMKGASPAARALYSYLQSPPARDIFKRYGFELPEED